MKTSFERPLADTRALAYLSGSSPVPYRAELLFSLVSTALSYDPHGYGLPYAGYFSGGELEDFTALCLQVLGLLLQDGADVGLPPAAAVVAWRPQEAPSGPASQLPKLGSEVHAFRDLLASVESEREVSFLISGVVALLGTVTEERSTYLPSSMRVPTFLPELLLLVFHLAACTPFTDALSAQGETSALVEGLLHVGTQVQVRLPENVSEGPLRLLAGAALLRLTGNREVCIAMNDDFEGDTPDGLPEFDGSVGDLAALACLKAISDHLASGPSNWLHSCLVEVHLCTLGNLSIFSEGLAMETCLRLFALLERCTKSVQINLKQKQEKEKASSGVGVWLPRLLEVFLNIVQYQYGLNTNLVYGLMSRRGVLSDLATGLASLRGHPHQEKDTPNGQGGGPEQALEQLHEHEQGPTADGPGHQAPAPVPTQAQAQARTLEWWRDSESLLQPLLGLVEAVVPKLEAEVEKRDISTPEEAKELLPRSVLGLLPVPHAFAMRSLRYFAGTHYASELCLVSCLRLGPLASIWDVQSSVSGSDARPAPAKPKAKPKGPAQTKVSAKGSAAPADRRGSARERSVSRRRPAPSGGGRERSVSRGPARSGGGPRQPPTLPGASTTPTVAPVAEEAGGRSALMAQLEAAAAEGIDLMALARQLQAQKAGEGGS